MPGIRPAAGSETAAAAGHSKPSASGAGESTPVHHFSSLSGAEPSPQPEAASDEPDATSVSALQARVAAALAQGCSVSAAASAAGVHRTTVHHWQRTSPRFRAAVEQARREFTESLADDMLDLAHSAVRTLQDLLDNPGTPAAIRLKAALSILERPQYPKRGWNLPARIETPAQQEVVDAMAELEADYQIVRMTEEIRKHERGDFGESGATQPRPSAHDFAAGDYATVPRTPARGGAEDDEPGGSRHGPRAAAAIPRNALCPCGSGHKYKRCCGKDAPPVFSGNAAG